MDLSFWTFKLRFHLFRPFLLHWPTSASLLPAEDHQTVLLNTSLELHGTLLIIGQQVCNGTIHFFNPSLLPLILYLWAPAVAF